MWWRVTTGITLNHVYSIYISVFALLCKIFGFVYCILYCLCWHPRCCHRLNPSDLLNMVRKWKERHTQQTHLETEWYGRMSFFYWSRKQIGGEPCTYYSYFKCFNCRIFKLMVKYIHSTFALHCFKTFQIDRLRLLFRCSWTSAHHKSLHSKRTDDFTEVANDN